MAVLVEFAVPGATEEKMWAVEERTRARGEAAGGPPYVGLMFLAAVPTPTGLRMVSTWRTEADFRTTLATMMGPDLADVGLVVADVAVSPVASMAIPGAHGP